MMIRDSGLLFGPPCIYRAVLALQSIMVHSFCLMLTATPNCSGQMCCIGPAWVQLIYVCFCSPSSV